MLRNRFLISILFFALGYTSFVSGSSLLDSHHPTEKFAHSIKSLAPGSNFISTDILWEEEDDNERMTKDKKNYQRVISTNFLAWNLLIAHKRLANSVSAAPYHPKDIPLFVRFCNYRI
jgi:hypothetical protein